MSFQPAIFDALDIRPGRRWARSDAWLWMQGQADAAGQITTTLRAMSDAFGWPRTTLRRFLADLEDVGAILVEGSGQVERVISLCVAAQNHGQQKKSGQRPELNEPRASVIRAPSAPDKRAAFFAAMVNGPDPVAAGTISPLMAQALVKGGLVTAEALRRKGVSA
jgi:hypothetical protein